MHYTGKLSPHEHVAVGAAIALHQLAHLPPRRPGQLD
jgi:hypothetical protein